MVGLFSITLSQKSQVEMPELLSLPAHVIEQLAKVRLDEPIDYYTRDSRETHSKSYCFWVLRDLGHSGLYAAAWEARHAVVKGTLRNVARLGDAEWCHFFLAQRQHSPSEKVEALRMAALFGQTAVAAMLVDEHGASVAGEALYAACDYGHVETARFLLEKGSNVHMVDEGPLRGAAQKGNAAIAKLVLEYGASPLHKTRELGKNAIEWAEDSGHSSVATMLRAHVASANNVAASSRMDARGGV